MAKKKQKSVNFQEAVSWEYVHAFHKLSDGAVNVDQNPLWIDRVIESARRGGYKGKITRVGAAKIINRNLY